MASYNAPVDFRISEDLPDNLPPELQPVIQEIYDGMQAVIQTLVNLCGIGPQPTSLWAQLAGGPDNLLAGNLNRLYVPASEDLPLGTAINLFNDAGTLKMRKADATDNTKSCDGFVSVIEGVLLGEVGECWLNNGTAVLGGLVVGTRYYLSTTPGVISNAPAVAAGNIEQYLGIAITENFFSFNVGYWIQH